MTKIRRQRMPVILTLGLNSFADLSVLSNCLAAELGALPNQGWGFSDMTKGIRIHAHGGPEVLRYDDIELPPPGPGQVRVRHTAIGINYSDVNVRRGGFYLNKTW